MATVPPECPPSPDSSESEGAPFPDVDPAIPVYIPIGTKQQYMSAPGWDHLTNFIETENFPYSGIENIQVDVTPQDECIYDHMEGKSTALCQAIFIYATERNSY